MSSGIDYSKWDKLECSSEEEEDPPRRPTVQKLPVGTSVTVGPEGISTRKARGPHEVSTTPPTTRPRPFTRNGQWVSLANASFYYGWSQTREAIEVRILVGFEPTTNTSSTASHSGQSSAAGRPRTKVRRVALMLDDVATRPSGTWSIVFTIEHAASVQHAGGVVRVPQDGEHRLMLWHDVEALTDDAWCVESTDPRVLLDDGMPASWILPVHPDHRARLLVVELRKKVQTSGVSIWWPQLSAVGESPLDMRTDIPDRAPKAVEKAQSFAEAWQQAHDIFRSRRSHATDSADPGEDFVD